MAIHCKKADKGWTVDDAGIDLGKVRPDLKWECARCAVSATDSAPNQTVASLSLAEHWHHEHR